MKRLLSRYLYALGVVQLLGLNLGGFFWLAWASGIREARQSSRRWVIGIHSAYLAFCAWALFQWFLHNGHMNCLTVYGREVQPNRFIVLAFILLLILIYGLPVAWLMSKKVRQEFIEQGAEGDAVNRAP